MPVVTAVHSGGIAYKYLDIDGRRYPCEFGEDIIRNIPNVKIREDDVIICGHLRSGTHWMFEVIQMLLRGSAETVPLWKGMQMLEFSSDTDMQNIPSPRVLNTHVHYKDLPRTVPTLGNKIVYLVRDPRDVAVSFFNFHKDIPNSFYYEGTWEDFLPIFTRGEVGWDSWFDHIRTWERVILDKVHPHVLVVYYEDSIQNLRGTVDRLSDFLELDTDDDLRAAITDKCSFARMKKDKEQYTYIVEGKNVMYRKGESGDWRNWFTVAQMEMFDAELRKQARDLTLVRRYMPK